MRENWPVTQNAQILAAPGRKPGSPLTVPAARRRAAQLTALEAKGGKARLRSPTALDGDWKPETDAHVKAWAADMKRDGQDTRLLNCMVSAWDYLAIQARRIAAEHPSKHQDTSNVGQGGWSCRR
jgi:hypothetical protein